MMRLHLQGYHLLWRCFPTVFDFSSQLILWSYNPRKAVTFLVWAVPCSLAATEGITIVFSSSGYLDVSVHRVCFPFGISAEADGLPHSDIFGSQTACVYPKLFAACHVLHRLQVPRHPPYTLPFFLHVLY